MKRERINKVLDDQDEVMVEIERIARERGLDNGMVTVLKEMVNETTVDFLHSYFFEDMSRYVKERVGLLKSYHDELKNKGFVGDTLISYVDTLMSTER